MAIALAILLKATSPICTFLVHKCEIAFAVKFFANVREKFSRNGTSPELVSGVLRGSSCYRVYRLS